MQLLLFALALGSYYAFHSFLAHNQVKAFLIGKLIHKKYYRLLFNFCAISLLLPLYFFYRIIEVEFLFKITFLNYIGFLIAAIGGILLVLALKQYNLAEFVGTQQLRNTTSPLSPSLKITGFNSIVRHPLYFATLLIFWGSFLFRPTDLVLVIALVSTTYLYVGTKLEEDKLIGEFGEAYLLYQQKVGMLIPFWK